MMERSDNRGLPADTPLHRLPLALRTRNVLARMGCRTVEDALAVPAWLLARELGAGAVTLDDFTRFQIEHGVRPALRAPTVEEVYDEHARVAVAEIRRRAAWTPIGALLALFPTEETDARLLAAALARRRDVVTHLAEQYLTSELAGEERRALGEAARAVLSEAGRPLTGLELAEAVVRRCRTYASLAARVILEDEEIERGEDGRFALRGTVEGGCYPSEPMSPSEVERSPIKGGESAEYGRSHLAVAVEGR